MKKKMTAFQLCGYIVMIGLGLTGMLVFSNAHPLLIEIVGIPTLFFASILPACSREN